MKTLRLLLPILLIASTLSALGASRQPSAGGLADKPFLYEVTRHLYRWYMDEVDVEKATDGDRFVFWVRGLNPELDPNDNSKYGEIILPALGIHVKVKKADYMIEELDLVVKHDDYKIVNVGRVSVPEEPPEGFVVVNTSYDSMVAYLFKNRNKLEFPSEDLREKLGGALAKKIKEDAAARGEPLPGGEEVFHISSLSPVANELWVFWETGRLLIRFSADIDLSDEAIWDHQELGIDLFDIDEQVVVSLREVAGSNAYMTRDQVGRILFNCIVLGNRLAVKPVNEIR